MIIINLHNITYLDKNSCEIITHFITRLPNTFTITCGEPNEEFDGSDCSSSQRSQNKWRTPFGNSSDSYSFNPDYNWTIVNRWRFYSSHPQINYKLNFYICCGNDTVFMGKYINYVPEEASTSYFPHIKNIIFDSTSIEYLYHAFNMIMMDNVDDNKIRGVKERPRERERKREIKEITQKAWSHAKLIYF